MSYLFFTTNFKIPSIFLKWILFLLVFFGFSIVSAETKCISHYQPKTPEISILQKLTNFFEQDPDSYPLLTFTKFIESETQKLESSYAELLNRLNSAGSDNQLVTVLAATENILQNTEVKIKSFVHEIEKSKPDSNAVNKIGKELSSCYTNLKMCRSSLKDVIVDTNEFYKTIQTTESYIKQTQELLTELKSNLRYLGQKYSGHQADIDSFITMKIRGLDSYLLVLNSFYSEQLLRLRQASTYDAFTIPELVQQLIKLDSKGNNFGILADYLKSVQEPKPIVDKTSKDVTTKSGTSNFASHFNNTPHGKELIEFIDQFNDPNFNEVIYKKFLLLLKKQDDPNSLKKLSLKDAKQIFEKLANLRLSLIIGHVLFNESGTTLFKTKFFLTIDYSVVVFDKSKYVYDNSINGKNFQLRVLLGNFIVLMGLLDHKFSIKDNTIVDDFFSFFQNYIQKELDKNEQEINSLKKKTFWKLYRSKYNLPYVDNILVREGLNNIIKFLPDFKKKYLDSAINNLSLDLPFETNVLGIMVPAEKDYSFPKLGSD